MDSGGCPPRSAQLSQHHRRAAPSAGREERPPVHHPRRVHRGRAAQPAGDQAGESGYQIFAELCNKIAIEDNIVTDIFTLGNTYDDGNKDSCIAACEGFGENAGLLKGKAVFLGNKSIESIASELKEIFTSKEVTEVMNEDFKASVANEFDFKNEFDEVMDKAKFTKEDREYFKGKKIIKDFNLKELISLTKEDSDNPIGKFYGTIYFYKLMSTTKDKEKYYYKDSIGRKNMIKNFQLTL